MIWLALYLYVLGAIDLTMECLGGGHNLTDAILRSVTWPVLYAWILVGAIADTLRR